MRILHVSQPATAGTAAVVRALTEFGIGRGDDVVVCCPADGELSEWTARAGATWIPLELQRAPGLHDLKHWWKLRGLIRDYDVVHFHSSKAGALGRFALRTVRPQPRSVFTPHGWSWYVGGGQATAYKLVERIAARWVDTITTVSQGEFEDGRAVLGAEAPLRVVENGVDVDRYTPSGAAAPRPDDVLLVQVGRLSPQKGQDRSIRALAELGPGFVLRLIGDGPQRADLERLAADLGVQQQIEFVGATDPRPHMRAADIVLLPSRWEGMSLVLLEAMAIGAAIITTDCRGSDSARGAARLIRNSAPEPQVVNSIAEQVRLLSQDAELRSSLGSAAHHAAVEKHSLPDTLQRYADVWTG